jgi:AraC-like DNA-binding protein
MQPIQLRDGDFILLPSTPAFWLRSHPDAPSEHRDPSYEPLRHGEQEGDPDFVSLGGSFALEPVNAPLRLALLPKLVHVPSAMGRATKLGRIIEMIRDECGGEDIGKEMMLDRMLELLLIEALRSQTPATGENAGMLRGMRDPSLARVLRAMHADVKAAWTVASLADIAGLSRSAFAARFSSEVGCGPSEYLNRWRMALAKNALMRGTQTLDQIAHDIGYESASAFSTAFRKRLGCAPGKFARELAMAA